MREMKTDPNPHQQIEAEPASGRRAGNGGPAGVVLGDQHHADQQQEREREDLHRGVPVHEVADALVFKLCSRDTRENIISARGRPQ